MGRGNRAPASERNERDEPDEPTRRSECAARGDSGSVTPLVIGMVACLLLLTAGLTAATSAFLAHQRLRNACDGAAVAGAGAVSGSGDTALGGTAEDAVATYLGVRSPGVSASVDLDGGTVTLTCRTRADIAFGALFGAGRMDQMVVSVASTRL